MRVPGVHVALLLGRRIDTTWDCGCAKFVFPSLVKLFPLSPSRSLSSIYPSIPLTLSPLSFAHVSYVSLLVLFLCPAGDGAEMPSMFCVASIFAHTCHLVPLDLCWCGSPPSCDLPKSLLSPPFLLSSSSLSLAHKGVFCLSSYISRLRHSGYWWWMIGWR